MEGNCDNITKLSLSQIQSMTKNEIGELLYGIIQLNSVSFQALGVISKQLDKLDQLDKIDDIKAGTKNLTENIKSLTDRINVLETAKNQMADSDWHTQSKELDQRLSVSIKEIDKAQIYQQRFIEQMDARSRRNNLVIIGIVEETVASPLGLKDEDRVLQVIQKTGVSVSMENLTLKRLGSSGDRSTPRPLLITLDNHETCKEIVMNAKNLRDVSDCASIFIRRDTHPTLRYEANRIRIREREEKADPRNSNAEIRYDRKERVLLKNGRIIDRFRPSFL